MNWLKIQTAFSYILESIKVIFMRLVLQRVSFASVEVEKVVINSISNGFLLLLGIEHDDMKEDAEWLANKVINMRIFSDEAGLMNLSLENTNGEILVISQFTLFASTKKGNRPSFIRAARPEHAIPLYEYFVQCLEKQLLNKVKTGIFGADMKVNLTNDGPVTIFIDTKQKE